MRSEQASLFLSSSSLPSAASAPIEAFNYAVRHTDFTLVSRYSVSEIANLAMAPSSPIRLSGFTLLLLSPSTALRPTPAPASSNRDGTTSRRALLSTAATGTLSAASLLAAAAPVLAKDKGYLTLSEYQAIKLQEKKDEELYGLFEALRERAGQTGEFAALVEKDDLKGVSKLALAWDSNIRQPLMDKAAKQLTGADKDAGLAASKKVLDDLKELDKVAKAGSKAEVDGLVGSLKGHVLDFVALEPKKLADKFGVGDL